MLLSVFSTTTSLHASVVPLQVYMHMLRSIFGTATSLHASVSASLKAANLFLSDVKFKHNMLTINGRGVTFYSLHTYHIQIRV